MTWLYSGVQVERVHHHDKHCFLRHTSGGHDHLEDAEQRVTDQVSRRFQVLLTQHGRYDPLYPTQKGRGSAIDMHVGVLFGFHCQANSTLRKSSTDLRPGLPP